MGKHSVKENEDLIPYPVWVTINKSLLDKELSVPGRSEAFNWVSDHAPQQEQDRVDGKVSGE